MNLRNATIVSSFAALALSATTASAAITGVTGSTTWLGSPPVAATPGALSGFNAFAWDEQQNVPLSLPVDMVNNPGSSLLPTPGAVSGNYDSHFLHWESLPGAIGATGTVTFATPIVAVIFRAISLDNSDAPAGALGTTYPTFYPTRGLLVSNPPSFVTILGNTLTFDFFVNFASLDLHEVRVLTNPVPAPGAAGLIAGAGLLAMRRRRRMARA